jgi:PST family polysaccharide transporter
MIEGWLKLVSARAASRLAGESQLRAILANIGWLFADRVARMIASLLVGVWFARYLGPEGYGTFIYAATFVAMFAPLATLGLDDVVVREIVNDGSGTGATLGSAFVLKAAATAGTFAAVAVAIRLVRPDDGTIHALVVILAAGTLFQAFDVIAFWFASQVQSKYTVYARNGAFVVGVGAKISLILAGAPLAVFAAATSAELALSAAGLAFWYVRRGERIRGWRVDGARVRRLLSDSWPLILSGMAIMVYMRIDQLMLGSMLGTHAVGIYATAARLSEIWYFIPVTIAASVGPSVIEAKRRGEDAYYARIQRIFNVMTYFSVTIALLMSVSSGAVVVGLFGPEFAAAAPVLTIHVWAGCFVFLGVARQVWIVNEGHTRAALVFTTIGAVTKVALNLWFIPVSAEIGAAVATVISYAISDFVVYLVVPRFRRMGYMMVRSLLFMRSRS